MRDNEDYEVGVDGEGAGGDYEGDSWNMCFCCVYGCWEGSKRFVADDQ